MNSLGLNLDFSIELTFLNCYWLTNRDELIFLIAWSDIHSTGSDHGSGLGVYGIRTQEGHFVVNGGGTIWRDGRDQDLAQCSLTCASLHIE